MKTFEFRLKADVSYLEEQFKDGAKQLAALAQQAEKAENKLQIFQEANVYLAEMDAMLLKIQKNYPDLFKKIFDGVDKQVKDAMAPFKQMPEVIGKALDKVGTQMQGVLNDKNNRATIADIKQWSKSIETAAKALDIKVDLDFLNNTRSNKVAVEGLISVLKQLREAYRTTSDAAERANIAPIVPEIKQKKKRDSKTPLPTNGGGSGIEGSGAGSGKEDIDDLTNSYTKLKQEIKDIRNGKDIDDIVDAFKIAEDEIDKLADILYEVDEPLSDTMLKLKDFLGTKFTKISLKDITDDVEKYIELTKKQDELIDKGLKNLTKKEKQELDQIRDEITEVEALFEVLKEDSSYILGDLTSGDIDKDSVIKQLADMLGVEVVNSANSAAAATESTTDEVNKQIKSYEELNTVVQRYNELILKNVSGKKRTKDENDELSNLIDRIRQTKGTTDPNKMIDDMIAFNAIHDSILGTTDVDKMAQYLGIEIPKAANVAENAIENLDNKVEEAKVDTQAAENAMSQLAQEAKEVAANASAGTGIDTNILTPINQTPADLGQEHQDLDLLKQKLVEVEQAIKDKTAAFDAEKVSVDENITAEIAKLEELKSELLEIANSIKNINDIKLNTATPKQDDKPLQGEQLAMDLDAAMKQDEQAIKNEISTLDVLNGKIGEITTTINAKTEAFKAEGATVDTIVNNEIAALDRLIAKLNEVKSAVDSKSDAFKQEEGAVKDSVKKATRKKKEATKKQEISDSQKKEAQDIEVQAAAEMKVNAELDEQIAKRKQLSKMHAYYNQYESGLKDSTIQEKVKLNIGQAVKQIGGLSNPNPSSGITGNIAEFSGADTLERDYAKLAAYKEMLEQIGYTLSKPVFNEKDGILSAKIIPIDGQAITDLEQARKILEDIYIHNQPISGADVADTTKESEDLQQQLVFTKELIKQRGTLNYLEKEAKNAEKLIRDTWNDGQAEQYEQLIVAIHEYKKSKEVVSEEELAYIRETISGYQQQAKAIKDAKAEEEKSKNAFGKKEITNASNRIKDAEAYGRQFKDSSTVQDQLTRVREIYSQLRIEQEKLANSTEVITEEQENAFRDLVNTFGAEYGKLKEIISKSQKEVKNSTFKPVDIDPSTIANTNNLKQVLMDAVKSAVSGKVRFGKFNEELGTMEYQVKDIAGQWSNFTAQLDATGTKIIGVQASLKKTNTFLKDIVDSTLSKMKSAIGNITGYDLIYRVINEVKRGITYVREIDAAMTELRKVTDETEETYKGFLQTMSKTAKVVGSTVADLTNSAADWGRLGYSIKEAGELAATTAKLLNVSEFSSVDDATSALVSALQAFTEEGYDVGKRAEEIVDILNNIGNKYPVATNELATGLSTSGAALVAANNSIEEQVALLSAGNATMQDISSVASGLKIVAARLRGTTTDIDDDADSAITNVSKLQEKIKALTKEANDGQGIDIINENGEYKSTYEILTEISKIFDKMDDVSSASLLEIIAGKNRSSVVAAILQNGKILESAYEDAFDSSGSAQRELDTYLNSIQGHIDQFTNSLQTMWMNFIETDAIKWFVHAGTAIVNLLDSMTKLIGPIPTLITLMGALFGLIKGFPALIGKIQASMSASNVAKKESTKQTSILSSAIKEESAARAANTAATNAETAALKANTAAQVANNKAHMGEIIDDIPGVDLPDIIDGQISFDDLTDGAHKAADATKEVGKAIDDIGDGAEVAKEIVGEVAEEVVGTTLTAGTSLAALGTKIAAFFATPLGVITGVVAAIGIVVAIVDWATTSFKEAKEKLEETTKELDTVRSELESLNNELKTTQEHIDELEGKGVLTFTEEEELKRLKAQNDELQRSVDLKAQQEKRLMRQQAQTAQETFGKDQKMQSLNILDSKSGLMVDSTLADRLSDQYNEAEKVLKDSQEKLLDAEKKYYADSSEENEKARKEAEDNAKLAEKNLTAIGQHITDFETHMQNTYGSLEWQYGDDLEQWQIELNNMLKVVYDYQDKLAIATDTTGRATQNAFNRVVNQQGFTGIVDQFKTNKDYIIDQLNQMVADYDEFGNYLGGGFDTVSDEGLKSFVQSMIDAGVVTDTGVVSIQKLIGLLDSLNDNTSKVTKANKKLERSEKRLEYYKKAKELNSYIKKLDELDDEDKKHITTIRNELAALEAQISAYDILSDTVNEAKKAFEEFENAKTTDSDNDYMSSAAEMMQTIVDGYQSAKMGTEAFKTAFTSMIPESVYEDIDTLQGKYEASAKYIKDVIGNYFKFEYDDDGLLTSVEATSKGIENFFTDMSKKKGPNGEPLMSFANGVWKVNETDWDNFVKYSGLTEEMLYALGMAADTVDADWIMDDDTTFLGSFDESLEAKIHNVTKALVELDEQLIDNLANTQDPAERDKLLKEYTESYRQYSEQLTEYTNDAITNLNHYNDATKAVDEATAELALAKEALTSATTDDEIKLATTQVDEALLKLATAQATKDDLSVPTELELTFAQDSVNAQIAAIQAQWTNTAVTLPVMIDGKLVENELIKLNDEGKYVVVNTELEGLSDEDVAILQGYADLVNTQGVINVYMENYQQEEDKLKTLNELVDDLEEQLSNLSVEIDTASALEKLGKLKGIYDQLQDKNVVVTVTEERASTTTTKQYEGRERNLTMASGTAYANGNWGAGVSTNKALVGELGPELRVRNGKYELIGADGAEFTDVRPNDIIFNHKQTEEILRNGHINSRGKAYVEGKAFNGNGGTMYTGGAIGAAYGGTVPDWFPRDSTLQNLGDGIGDIGKKLFDWFEILVEEMEAQISLMEAQLENSVGINAKKGIYSGLIASEQVKMDAFNKGIKLYTDQANKILAQIPAQYQALAQDGGIAISNFAGEANEKVVEAINNYREWANKAADLNIQLEETKAHISDLRVETQSMISTEYDNKISLITNLNDALEAEMGLLEESGKRISTKFYDEMIKNGESQLKLLQEKRDSMQAELDSAVKSGDVTKYSDDWYEMVTAIYEVDAAVIDCQTSIEGFNNSIQELHWENFEKIIDSITAVSDEAEQLRDLIDDTDITEASDPEKWSKDGVTALGLVAQQMENAQYRAELYAAEIEYLNAEFKNGKYSQDEYNEKLKELKDNQWDAIDAYESAKDAIIDLNKTRVEAIKDGIQKEIDAYEELINKRKEDLNAQQDAHEWAQSVADHTKNIDAIQRQIDAMEGDNSAAAIAQRKKLQEELAAAQAEYDEALYDRSIETQQQSLDKSLEVYRAEQEAKMEELDAWLEKEEQVIAESYATISANTEAIHSNIEAISDKYGIEIENNVVNPWTAGITALGTYGTELDTATSQYVEMLSKVKQELINLQLQADATADSLVNSVNDSASKAQSAVKDPVKTTSTPTTSSSSSSSSSRYSYDDDDDYYSSSKVTTGQQVTVDSNATNFSSKSGDAKMASFVPGSSYTVYQTSGNQVLIGRDGVYTGWVDKSDLVGYAKGTTGVKSDQLAWIDENGLEELVMHADNGRLTYLSKGSSVIPHDITENLMELGRVDPRTWMEKNRKSSVPASFVTNNNTIDLSFGSLINIEHADRDSIPDIQAAVQKQLDSYMKNINAGLKKYSR